MAIILVSGSRNSEESVLELVEKVLSSLVNQNEDIILSGGAVGPDIRAIRWAKACSTYHMILFPQWNRFGGSAGFKRNDKLRDLFDIALIFWDGKSHGTKDMIRKCLESVPDNSEAVKIWIGTEQVEDTKTLLTELVKSQVK